MNEFGSMRAVFFDFLILSHSRKMASGYLDLDVGMGEVLDIYDTKGQGTFSLTPEVTSLSCPQSPSAGAVGFMAFSGPVDHVSSVLRSLGEKKKEERGVTKENMEAIFSSLGKLINFFHKKNQMMQEFHQIEGKIAKVLEELNVTLSGTELKETMVDVLKEQKKHLLYYKRNLGGLFDIKTRMESLTRQSFPRDYDYFASLQVILYEIESFYIFDKPSLSISSHFHAPTFPPPSSPSPLHYPQRKGFDEEGLLQELQESLERETQERIANEGWWVGIGGEGGDEMGLSPGGFGCMDECVVDALNSGGDVDVCVGVEKQGGGTGGLKKKKKFFPSRTLSTSPSRSPPSSPSFPTRRSPPPRVSSPVPSPSTPPSSPCKTPTQDFPGEASLFEPEKKQRGGREGRGDENGGRNVSFEKKDSKGVLMFKKNLLKKRRGNNQQQPTDIIISVPGATDKIVTPPTPPRISKQTSPPQQHLHQSVDQKEDQHPVLTFTLTPQPHTELSNSLPLSSSSAPSPSLSLIKEPTLSVPARYRRSFSSLHSAQPFQGEETLFAEINMLPLDNLLSLVVFGKAEKEEEMREEREEEKEKEKEKEKEIETETEKETEKEKEKEKERKTFSCSKRELERVRWVFLNGYSLFIETETILKWTISILPTLSQINQIQIFLFWKYMMKFSRICFFPSPPPSFFPFLKVYSTFEEKSAAILQDLFETYTKEREKIVQSLPLAYSAPFGACPSLELSEIHELDELAITLTLHEEVIFRAISFDDFQFWQKNSSIFVEKNSDYFASVFQEREEREEREERGEGSKGGGDVERGGENWEKLIAFSLRLSSWISESLKTGSRQKKSSCLKNAIVLAESFLEMRNFSSCLSVIGGIQNWKNQDPQDEFIEENLLGRFQKIEKLMSSKNNFAAYRSYIEGSSPPCLPCIGVILMDIEEISASHFSTWPKVASVLGAFHNHLSQSYSLLLSSSSLQESLWEKFWQNENK